MRLSLLLRQTPVLAVAVTGEISGERRGWGGLASKNFHSPGLRGTSDLGSGQTDGQEIRGGRQERGGNKEFSRSLAHMHDSGHHCDLQGDHQGCRGKDSTSQNGQPLQVPGHLKDREMQRPKEFGMN